MYVSRIYWRQNEPGNGVSTKAGQVQKQMISEDVAIPHLLPHSAALAEHGWSRHAAELQDADALICEIARIGDLLGARAPGRAGAMEEVVRPRAATEAHPRSMSADYGHGALPFHTELSHRLRPCRYLLLGCFEPGSPGAATMLLDWRTLGFSPDELQLLQDAPILVRSGRHSFYSTILPPDRAYLRYDPCCLEAIDGRGQQALQLVEERLTAASPEVHHWCQGDILVIDNWRILHRRGPSGRHSGRRLARVLINVR